MSIPQTSGREELERAIRNLAPSSVSPFELAATAFSHLAGPLNLHVYFNYLRLDGATTMWLSSYHGIPPEAAREIQHLELGHAVCGTVAATGQPMCVEDVRNSADERAQLVRAFGVRAYSCYPLLADGRVIGTFSVGSFTRTSFSAAEMRLLEIAAGEVAKGIARLLPRADS